MKNPVGTIGFVIIALLAGAAVGLAAPPAGLALTPVAKWVLQLIKAAATPLVFFAVLEAILRFRVAGADFLKLLAITLINASLAIGIGLAVANLFQPGQYLRPLISATRQPCARSILATCSPGSCPAALFSRSSTTASCRW